MGRINKYCKWTEIEKYIESLIQLDRAGSWKDLLQT